MAVECDLITESERAKIYSGLASKIAGIDKLYSGYIVQQQRQIDRIRTDKNIKIPAGLDFSALPGLTNELAQKLTRARPENIAAASRIQGMTPAGLLILLRSIN